MTTKLTDSQKQTIRIALAKWMGFELITPNSLWAYDSRTGSESILIPNYTTSLDACHEVAMEVKKRSSFFYRKYLRTLRLEVRENVEDATAEHRSLALYRALNLGELGD